MWWTILVGVVLCSWILIEDGRSLIFKLIVIAMIGGLWWYVISPQGEPIRQQVNNWVHSFFPSTMQNPHSL